MFLEREVALSARGHYPSKGSNQSSVFPARGRRMARLQIRAGRRELFINHNVPAHFPQSLLLNSLEIREVDPPESEPPILWRLATTESIDTPAQVASVVDAYRQRWLIEEFFKALKTGCRYQQLQLQTGRALLVALAIETAIAWRMLLLRWIANPDFEQPATNILPEEQLKLLIALSEAESKQPLHKEPNVNEAIVEIARLGGHIKNNGPPGWLVLRRGLDKLLLIHRGMRSLNKSYDR
jgi:hypothetical protein